MTLLINAHGTNGIVEWTNQRIESDLLDVSVKYLTINVTALAGQTLHVLLAADTSALLGPSATARGSGFSLLVKLIDAAQPSTIHPPSER